MTPSRLRRSAVALAVLAFAFGTALGAQPPQGKRQPMYDTAKETTVKGTVSAVEKVARPEGRGRRGMGGLHATVKTTDESIVVHLGPVAYLDEKKLTLAEGDAVEIIGSRATIDDEPVLLAREIKKDGQTWTLRDKTGRPLWSGPRK